MTLHRFAPTLTLAALLGCMPAAHAVDGVILIDQARALAGNVTPGDAPGFPVTITRAGSYRLAGNLTVADPATVAVRILAADVTLDLNGFAIVGPGQCDPGGIGLCIDLGAHGVMSNGLSTVVNGTIRGMNGHGVLCTVSCRVEQLLVAANGGDGINAALGLVRANRVLGNGGWGLNLGVGPGAGFTDNLCANNAAGSVTGGAAIGGNVCLP